MFTGFERQKNAEQFFGDAFWQYDDEIVRAVWTLVRMASSDASNSFGAFVSDFLSMVSVLTSFYFLYSPHQLIESCFMYVVILFSDWYWGSTSCCFPSSWRVKPDTHLQASLFGWW